MHLIRSVVISDIHIGNNYRTCWYQKEVHEPYFATILEDVLRRKDEIRELVILGDLFDFWTYPPAMKPPRIEEILAANSNIFGPKGKLVEAVNALQGRVIYLRGNHDINITQEDLNKIPGDYRIALGPDVYVSDGVTYAHGHHYTLFNAPTPFDQNDPFRPPGGHYVTRSVSDMVERILNKAGSKAKTIADLPDWGVGDWSPAGFIPAIKDAIWGGDLDSVYRIFIDYVISQSGANPNGPIQLLDGRTSTLNQSKKTYEYLVTNWVNAHGGGGTGRSTPTKRSGPTRTGPTWAGSPRPSAGGCHRTWW
jgi:UDP-2,3-diacylglucosamine pyrophosphatase LpxH